MVRSQESTRLRRRYRSVFLSDLHLGSVGSQPLEVVAFLRSIECDDLYLVGDIVDGWVGMRGRKWRPDHSEVIRTILEVGSRNSRIHFCPGNHDAAFRKFLGYDVGSIRIDHQFVHVRPDGRRWLVVHGDLFDRSVTRYPRVAYVGAWSHEWLTMIDVMLARKNKERRNLSGRVKSRVKRLIGARTDYEESIIDHARSLGFDGVVCGHTHKPDLRELDDGFMYLNCGDWVDRKTAIVESFDGQIDLIHWTSCEDHLPRAPQVLV